MDDLLPPVTTDELRLLLDEMEKLDREIQRRYTEDGITYYIPNRMQLRAHQSKANTVLFVGGNRSGKTTFGATELAYHLTRAYPDWYPQERRFRHPIKAVVVATEFPIVQRVLEPKIDRYLPKALIEKRVRSSLGYLGRLVCKDGSTVDVLTSEMAQLAFESADWDFAWIDEPTQRSKYIAIRRGLVDRMGQCVITFTPIVEPWMKEELVDAADGIRIEAVTVDIRDNMVDVEGHPIQSETAIALFEQALTEDEKATRLHGQFFHLRGIVYSGYTPSIHEHPFEYHYPDPVIGVLDPHTRKPHHMLWAFIRRDDAICVINELSFSGPLQEFKRTVLLTEQQAGYKMRRRLIDPNFGHTPNIITGRTVQQELARPPFPVYFTEANDDKEAGIMKVRAQLHWDRTRAIDPLNTPKLFFHPRCVKTIRSLRNYQFDEWRGPAKDLKDPKEVDRQKDTDGADCVRYLCMSNPTFDQVMRQLQTQEPELEALAF